MPIVADAGTRHESDVTTQPEIFSPNCKSVHESRASSQDILESQEIVKFTTSDRTKSIRGDGIHILELTIKCERYRTIVDLTIGINQFITFFNLIFLVHCFSKITLNSKLDGSVV